ncbi:MAG: hypothetical protein RSE32_04385 [Comamonas sp.]|uniref:hypothetical protein n=1 Tax=Comamonas sp. TaxID=34028 RepID=UPI002FCCA47E
MRADKGTLFRKFIQEKFIGIAHLDNHELPLASSNDDLVREIYSLYDSDAINHGKLRQIRSFIQKICPNDWVITLDQSHICVGRILSNSIFHANDEDPSYRGKISLRRNVIWGPIIPRNRLPYDLRNSLKSNLTVFNVNKFAESIYHSIFPFFVKDEYLHTTLLINSHYNLKTSSIADLFNLVSSIEHHTFQAIANTSESVDFSVISTVKAEFSSPGDIRIRFKSIGVSVPKWIPITLIIYTLLFGNDWTGYQGLLDLKSRQAIISYILKIKEIEKSIELKQDLKLSSPDLKQSENLLSDNDKIISIGTILEEKKSNNSPKEMPKPPKTK